MTAAGPWLDCPCGVQHPRGCHGHVEECLACEWRGENGVGRPCTKCGGEVRRRPCRQAPRIGQQVCNAHGGRSPQAIAATEQRAELDRIAGQVAELLDHYDQPDEHPLEGLLAVVRRTGAMVRVLEHLVRGLDLHPIVSVEVVGDGYNAGGDTGERWRTENNALYGADSKGDGKPHVLVEMYRVWTADHAKACKLALDAGVDERRLRLEEAEVDQLFLALTRALQTAGLSVAQQEALNDALAHELRQLG